MSDLVTYFQAHNTPVTDALIAGALDICRSQAFVAAIVIEIRCNAGVLIEVATGGQTQPAIGVVQGSRFATAVVLRKESRWYISMWIWSIYISHLYFVVGHAAVLVELLLPRIVDGLIGQQLKVDGLRKYNGNLCKYQGQQNGGILSGKQSEKEREGDINWCAICLSHCNSQSN